MLQLRSFLAAQSLKNFRIAIAVQGPSISGILQSIRIALYIGALPAMTSLRRVLIRVRASGPLDAVSHQMLFAMHEIMPYSISRLSGSSSTIRMIGEGSSMPIELVSGASKSDYLFLLGTILIGLDLFRLSSLTYFLFCFLCSDTCLGLKFSAYMASLSSFSSSSVTSSSSLMMFMMTF